MRIGIQNPTQHYEARSYDAHVVNVNKCEHPYVSSQPGREFVRADANVSESAWLGEIRHSYLATSVLSRNSGLTSRRYHEALRKREPESHLEICEYGVHATFKHFPQNIQKRMKDEDSCDMYIPATRGIQPAFVIGQFVYINNAFEVQQELQYRTVRMWMWTDVDVDIE